MTCHGCGGAIVGAAYTSARLPGTDYHEQCWRAALAARDGKTKRRPRMNFKYKGAVVAQQVGAPCLVTVNFETDDMAAAEQLITGCRTLGMRAAEPAQKKAEPAPPPPKAKKPAPASVPEAPAEEEEEDENMPSGEDDEEEDEAEEEEAPPKPEPKTGAGLKITKVMQDPKTKFKGVIEELAKQGVSTKAKLTEICLKIRDKVPALKNVNVDEMDERVETAFDLLGLGE